MDDETLWAGFVAATLPQSAFTHESHLRIAFLHLQKFSLDEAHIRMRAGIFRLNAAHGLVESVERGYHETMTRFWLCAVKRACSGEPDSQTFCRLHPQLHDRELPFANYSRERLLSPEARARFVEPDLAPLA